MSHLCWLVAVSVAVDYFGTDKLTGSCVCAPTFLLCKVKNNWLSSTQEKNSDILLPTYLGGRVKSSKYPF